MSGVQKRALIMSYKQWQTSVTLHDPLKSQLEKWAQENHMPLATAIRSLAAFGLKSKLVEKAVTKYVDEKPL